MSGEKRLLGFAGEGDFGEEAFAFGADIVGGRRVATDDFVGEASDIGGAAEALEKECHAECCGERHRL